MVDICRLGSPISLKNNMSRLVILVTLFGLVAGCMRPVRIYKEDGKLMGIMPLKNGRVTYQDKQPLPSGLNKAEVFRRARRWWVDNYKSPKDVLQIVDAQTGELVGKGIGTVYVPYFKKGLRLPLNVNHTISIDVSDTTYVITASGFVVNQPKAGYTMITLNQYEIPIEQYNVGTETSVLGTMREIDKQALLSIKSIQQFIQTQQ